MRVVCAAAITLVTLSNIVCSGSFLGLALGQEIAPLQVSPPTLKGADPAECMQANSDYELYELG